MSVRVKSILAGSVIALFTIVAVATIYSTEPTAIKDGATKRSAMLVETMRAEKHLHQPTLTVMGVVSPAQQIRLRPRISGVITEVSDAFVPGSILKQGQWLIKLDDQDFALNVARAKTHLQSAQAAYDIEMGEQRVARDVFDRLQQDVSAMNETLMLREPQKRKVEADLNEAKLTVEEATLALSRTTIRMPFDGQIMSQDVNLGSHISPADSIARLMGTQHYWIKANLPLSKLKWLDTNSSNQDSSPNVSIHSPGSWPEGATRRGYLKQVIAELDPDTRMATVIVEVPDPLALEVNSDSQDNNINQAPLLAGAYVEVALPARLSNETVKVPLAFMRKQNTVWVMDADKLDIRQVKVAFKDDHYAYIERGLNAGDNIIKTNLSTVRQGADVRMKQQPESETAMMINQQ